MRRGICAATRSGRLGASVRAIGPVSKCTTCRASYGLNHHRFPRSEGSCRHLLSGEKPPGKFTSRSEVGQAHGHAIARRAAALEALDAHCISGGRSMD